MVTLEGSGIGVGPLSPFKIIALNEGRIAQPLVQTANIANIIQSTIACAERVDEREEQPDKADARVIDSPHGDVAFDHVDFCYSPDTPLIEDLTIDVHSGRRWLSWGRPVPGRPRSSICSGASMT